MVSPLVRDEADRDPLSVHIPERFNYVGVFLTLDCNKSCFYCINTVGKPRVRPWKGTFGLSGREWIDGLNRLRLPDDLPVTLQGGEPSLHPDFLEIILGLRDDLHIDILTNLSFDVERFVKTVPAERLRREAPYASIRVSYHPSQSDLDDLLLSVRKLMDEDYSVGVYVIDHPTHADANRRAYEECAKFGIDIRTKEFMGTHRGRILGTYRYADAMTGELRAVRCRPSELLIDPNGDVYRCHADLYARRNPRGHLLDADLRLSDAFAPCDAFGSCHPCDVKIKTNRFQEFGHTSVEIREVE
ncbi:MAG: radical SAM protein [Deltaproteobacteria bacterium]|nr:radical SAM protein [Deltaproteobacteria bacterium]